MTAVLPQFKLETRPQADPAAVATAGNVRLTVLGPRLLRMEYQPQGKFVDAPSQLVWYRRQPVPDFELRRPDGWLELETEALLLRLQPDLGFTPESLQVTIKASGHTWRAGDPPQANLKGTARTLDMVDGPLPLEDGLLNRDGWTLLDDSSSLLFDEDGWLAAREGAAEGRDWYFFGYGSDYQAALDDFFRISGPPPLLPRWALGNWWSRFWPYTQAELGSLMLDFKEHDVPLSVCIIDMDWHITQTGNQSPGWTGYTWNRSLFPDPPGFLDFLHGLGLKTALNLHPADGIHPHEAGYEAMARAVGQDPQAGEPVTFDPTDTGFLKAYLEYLHHPLEAQGVDFWWMDWQQGNPTRLPGLNLLWWINHLHYLDLGRSPEQRPFIFSRWGGLGNHRYPIGFSGDTYVSWASLAFQPYFTASAANVGYSWWSHDIGGHMLGVEEPELFLRWVQYGVFSPIMRLHSTATPYHERRPWGYDAEIERLASAAMRLRHRLIPYLYTAAWRNHTAGEALVRPLYHLATEREDAYAATETYTFGSELIAAPFVQPCDPDTRLARQAAWLPAGEWFGFWDGRYYEGDAWHAIYGTPADIPVFARAGAIVPLGPELGWGGVDNPAELEVRIYPGASNSYTLYEDDGQSQAFQQGESARTRFELDWQADRLEFTIHPVDGQRELLPEGRRCHLRFFALQAPAAVDIQGSRQKAEWRYDPQEQLLEVRDLLPDPGTVLRVKVSGDKPLHSADTRSEMQLQAMLAAFRMETEAKWSLSQLVPQILEDPQVLGTVAPALTDNQLRALLEVASGCGVHESRHSGEVVWALWNNRADPRFRYALAKEKVHTWHAGERFTGEGGLAPRSRVLRPGETPRQVWQLRAAYDSLWQVVLEASGGSGWAH